MDIIARRPGPSVQEVFATDPFPAPAVLREESPPQWLSTDDVSAERYFSRAWHDREVQQVWRKTWQMACRVEEIANVGDQIVYDVVDDSLIVVRTAPDRIKAYVNACLHRGTMLRTEAGNAKQIRCPFHGWTWALDGTLSVLPGQWDFPQVDKAKMCLPEADRGRLPGRWPRRACADRRVGAGPARSAEHGDRPMSGWMVQSARSSSFSSATMLRMVSRSRAPRIKSTPDRR